MRNLNRGEINDTYHPFSEQLEFRGGRFLKEVMQNIMQPRKSMDTKTLKHCWLYVFLNIMHIYQNVCKQVNIKKQVSFTTLLQTLPVSKLWTRFGL